RSAHRAYRGLRALRVGSPGGDLRGPDRTFLTFLLGRILAGSRVVIRNESAIPGGKNVHERRYSIRADHFEWSSAERNRRDERRCNDVSNTERRLPPALGFGPSYAGRGHDSGRTFRSQESRGRVATVLW